MSDQLQISATVSAATKERLDRFTESHGLKKNFVVEQALLYFMDARRELPDEALIPTRLLLDEATFGRIVALLETPPAPTPARSVAVLATAKGTGGAAGHPPVAQAFTTVLVSSAVQSPTPGPLGQAPHTR